MPTDKLNEMQQQLIARLEKEIKGFVVEESEYNYIFKQYKLPFSGLRKGHKEIMSLLRKFKPDSTTIPEAAIPHLIRYPATGVFLRTSNVDLAVQVLKAHAEDMRRRKAIVIPTAGGN